MPPLHTTIANLVNKTDFDDKLKNFNKKNYLSKTKHVLVDNELKKYRHMTQVFLFLKVPLIMIDHKIT